MLQFYLIATQKWNYVTELCTSSEQNNSPALTVINIPSLACFNSTVGCNNTLVHSHEGGTGLKSISTHGGFFFLFLEKVLNYFPWCLFWIKIKMADHGLQQWETAIVTWEIGTCSLSYFPPIFDTSTCHI